MTGTIRFGLIIVLAVATSGSAFRPDRHQRNRSPSATTFGGLVLSGCGRTL